MEAKIPIIYEAGYHQATTIGKRRKAGRENLIGHLF